MKEILMELEVLRQKMEKYTENEIPFSKIIYAITNKLERNVLFNMSNKELISHIQKIQMLES